MRNRRRAKLKNATLIRRYDISSEESKRKMQDALDELVGLSKELAALSKIKSRRERDFVRNRALQIDGEFNRASADYLWELNVVIANGKSVAALMEAENAKLAMAERRDTGIFRVKAIAAHDEALLAYRKILQKNQALREA